MKLHLRKRFPAETEQLSEGQLYEFLMAGIERAARYGVVIEDDVQRYVDFSVIYGREFDIDPKLRWVRQILSERTLDGTAKMDRIQLHHELEKIERA